MKKKILIASYNLDFGGIETSLINLLKNMDLKKYEITLTLEEKKGVFLKEVPSFVKIKEYKVSNNKNFLIRKISNFTRRIKWLLFNYKRYYTSICYATYSGPCGFLARTSSKNRILYVHSNYYYVYDKDIDKIRKFFDKRKIENYDHIVFVSNESKNDLCKIYPSIKEKSFVINNLIDYERILKLSEEKIDINTDKKVVLFVGRLEEKAKKISRIIEVANKMKKDNVEFWIVGEGESNKEYKKLIERYKLNNVKLLGAKSNPYPYMKRCDVLILTSDYEGFPVVYNEAIVLNKPILSTINVSDDIISIHNRFGIITDKEIDSICNNLKIMLKKKYIVKEQIDFKVINKKRMEALEKLMENKK